MNFNTTFCFTLVVIPFQLKCANCGEETHEFQYLTLTVNFTAHLVQNAYGKILSFPAVCFVLSVSLLNCFAKFDEHLTKWFKGVFLLYYVA